MTNTAFLEKDFVIELNKNYDVNTSEFKQLLNELIASGRAFEFNCVTNKTFFNNVTTNQFCFHSDNGRYTDYVEFANKWCAEHKDLVRCSYLNR